MKLLITIIPLILTACDPGRAPEINTYTLDTTPIIKPAQKPKPITLLVSPVKPASTLETNQMLYTQSPHQYNTFTKNTWLVPPADMLTPLIVETLSASGHYQHVIMGPSSAHSDYRLDIQLLELHQDFQTTPSTVRVTIAAQLINQSTGKIKTSQQFSQTIETSEDNPSEGVRAANQVLAALLRRLVQDFL